MNSKAVYRWAVIYLMVGAAVFSVSGIFRHQLSDFALGFCEGVSVVLILGSAIYLIRYFLKKKTL